MLAQSRPPLSVSPKASSTNSHCAVYFAMPDPFELLPCWCNGLAGTLPCEARACSLSLSARVFRSLFRPLSNRSAGLRRRLRPPPPGAPHQTKDYAQVPHFASDAEASFCAIGETGEPGPIFCRLPVITRSFSARPVTLTESPSVGPSVTIFCSAFVRADDVDILPHLARPPSRSKHPKARRPHPRQPGRGRVRCKTATAHPAGAVVTFVRDPGEPPRQD